jgi:CRISPR-associated endonuclease/helicase Cas3
MASALTPLPFSETFAHPNDPLPVHLERVAERAAASIAPTAQAEIRAIAAVAGLFHDLGKATPWFQDYLLRRGRRSALSHHAESGAVLAWWYSGELDWPLWQRLATFIAVRRHHGALLFQAWPDLLEQTRDTFRDPAEALPVQVATLDLPGIHGWLVGIAERHPDFGLPTALRPLTVDSIEARLRDQRIAGGSKLRKAFGSVDQALATLAGFGALLAVDKTDAALQGGRIARQALPANAVTVYQRKIPPNLPFSKGGIHQRREQIAALVARTWLAHLATPLLTLTAPTGAGKTLTILHAALQVRSRLAEQWGVAPRIIYCLPFTSVIDQNHAVFRAVLRSNGLPDQEDLLLKHHHLTEAIFRTGDSEHQADGAGQLLTETWQSELVVTTFHQLLHSLLSPRNANLKRAGQLTGALVLLDEVQALPLRYWEALRQLLMAATRSLGARFVLLTATRPLIFQPGDAVELLPDHETHFRALTRTRLYGHHREPLGVDAFAERLITGLRTHSRAALVIVNRRRAVRSLFAVLREALPGRPLVALSTSLTPLDRRVRIRLIQRLLRQGQPVVAITTQLVEAGVDFSFPVVHRDLGPLDSIIQAAGRCNRHGENSGAPGEVYLWQLQANRTDGSLGERLWQRVYDSALIEVTLETLGEADTWEECEFLELSQRYFAGCRARQDQVRVDEQLARGDLAGVEHDFRLIADGPPTVSLFIVQKPGDVMLWERYRAIWDDPQLGPAKQEQRFRPFKRAFYERVVQVYAQEAPGLDRDAVNRLDAGPETYDREAGFIGLLGESAVCIF